MIDENFTVTQSLSDPNLLTVTDTSTGSDADIASRRVTITLPNGRVLVEADNVGTYSVWPYADSSIELDVLSRSVAVVIKVEWLNAGGTVLYTKSIEYAFTLHDDLFNFEQLGNEASDPSIIKDSRYYGDVVRFMADLEHAKNAIIYGADTAAAQSALDRNYQMQLNESIYF